MVLELAEEEAELAARDKSESSCMQPPWGGFLMVSLLLRERLSSCGVGSR